MYELIDLADHSIILGQVKSIYADEEILTAGEINPKQMNPIIFTKTGSKGIYWTIGENIGAAWSIGKKHTY